MFDREQIGFHGTLIILEKSPATFQYDFILLYLSTQN